MGGDSSSDDSLSSGDSSLYDDLSELSEDDEVPWVGRDIEVDTPQRHVLNIFQGAFRFSEEMYYGVKELLRQQGDNCTVTDEVLDELKRQRKLFRLAYRNIMELICDDNESIISL